MIQVIHQDQLVAADSQQIATLIAPGTTVTIPASFAQQHPGLIGQFYKLLYVCGGYAEVAWGVGRDAMESRPNGVEGRTRRWGE